jgi:hypothetical protein
MTKELVTIELATKLSPLLEVGREKGLLLKVRQYLRKLEFFQPIRGFMGPSVGLQQLSRATQVVLCLNANDYQLPHYSRCQKSLTFTLIALRLPVY